MGHYSSVAITDSIRSLLILIFATFLVKDKSILKLDLSNAAEMLCTTTSFSLSGPHALTTPIFIAVNFDPGII